MTRHQTTRKGSSVLERREAYRRHSLLDVEIKITTGKDQVQRSQMMPRVQRFRLDNGDTTGTTTPGSGTGTGTDNEHVGGLLCCQEGRFRYVALKRSNCPSIKVCLRLYGALSIGLPSWAKCGRAHEPPRVARLVLRLHSYCCRC